MALEQVKGFVRSRMRTLGYTEWQDAINFQNVPKNLLNNRFHIEFGRADLKSQTMQPLDITWPFTVRIWKRPRLDTLSVMDDCIAASEIVIKDLLKASNRLTYNEPNPNYLKNVLFSSFRLEPLADTNDNGVIGVMEYSALVVINID